MVQSECQRDVFLALWGTDTLPCSRPGMEKEQPLSHHALSPRLWRDFPNALPGSIVLFPAKMSVWKMRSRAGVHVCPGSAASFASPVRLLSLGRHPQCS